MDAIEMTDSDISLAIVSDKAIAELHETWLAFRAPQTSFRLISQARVTQPPTTADAYSWRDHCKC